MSVTYPLITRDSISVTNVTNEAVEVYDGQDSFRFGPNETKVLKADLALRVQAQNTSHLSLPDLGANGSRFWPEHPKGNNKTGKLVQEVILYGNECRT